MKIQTPLKVLALMLIATGIAATSFADTIDPATKAPGDTANADASKTPADAKASTDGATDKKEGCIAPSGGGALPKAVENTNEQACNAMGGVYIKGEFTPQQAIRICQMVFTPVMCKSRNLRPQLCKELLKACKQVVKGKVKISNGIFSP